MSDWWLRVFGYSLILKRVSTWANKHTTDWSFYGSFDAFFLLLSSHLTTTPGMSIPHVLLHISHPLHKTCHPHAPPVGPENKEWFGEPINPWCEWLLWPLILSDASIKITIQTELKYIKDNTRKQHQKGKYNKTFLLLEQQALQLEISFCLQDLSGLC